ncbi:MAG: hypothetical protein JRN22_00440 [Nitrososphaerota archaeon]|nr:hypothetical protein [Nitrososphaerota archaeon]
MENLGPDEPRRAQVKKPEEGQALADAGSRTLVVGPEPGQGMPSDGLVRQKIDEFKAARGYVPDTVLRIIKTQKRGDKPIDIPGPQSLK